ncbi:SAM-dependent methyltransferase [Actinomycetospora endophytica]|uniref:S-adenosyl-L-methionine-dependent methyltransferase n=1 Tax=Actinomycetospora endophytica TaxID=2291215 RepID=A0ABS8P694_9PSEU|nr:SAM-dependent methyltransferase [Actinomycetospora endophytica]MCD2193784.1 SAM-dependent methyltransferase [Actinomycetospora endophytica]
MAPTIPDGVGWTALVVSAQRAAESRRPDALFQDPLAEALVERVGEDAIAAGPGPDGGTDQRGTLARVMGDFLPVRTCFFDRVVTEHPTPQVVILAAGLDGRAYRLERPAGTVIYEVDVPEVLAFRDAVADDLTPTVEHRPVAIDLREDWPEALLAAGFDPTVPTTWLVEGLLIYLPADAADLLLDRLTGLSAPGSAIGVEYADRDPASAMTGLAGTDDPGAQLFADLVEAGPRDSPARWLGSRGWTVEESTVREQAGLVGRPVPAIMDPELGGMDAWLARARR